MPSESNMIDIFMMKVEVEGRSSGDCVCMRGRPRKRNKIDSGKKIFLPLPYGNQLSGKTPFLLHGTMH